MLNNSHPHLLPHAADSPSPEQPRRMDPPSLSGRSSPTTQRRQLQGPRPPRLNVRMESHAIKKLSASGPQVQPAPGHGQGRLDQQPPPRSPVIIYDASPKVIHAKPSEFMALVQRLTGPVSACEPPLPAPEAQGHHQAEDDDSLLCGQPFLPPELLLSPSAAMSPSARLATIERSVRSTPPVPDYVPEVAASVEVDASSLTWISAAASESASSSALSSSGGAAVSGSCEGGGRNDIVKVIEKKHIFDKVVTVSDVGKLNRLRIPKRHADKCVPLDRAGKLWRFRYSYWNSPTAAAKRMRLFGVNLDNPQPGGESSHDTDAFSLWMPGWQRQTTLRYLESLSSSGLTMSSDTELEEVWHYKDPSGEVQGPFTLLQLSMWTSYFPRDLRVWLTFESEERSLLLTEVLSKQQTVFTQATSVSTSAKRPLVGIEHSINSPSLDQTSALSSTGYSMLHSKGTSLRVFDEPEPWSKDVESDASEVTKVVRRQRLDKNVGSSTLTEKDSSTLTEEDSFYPRHKYLYRKEKVAKSHSTLHEDVKAWIAIKKQYKGGLHHTCVQQVGPKLLGRNNIEQRVIEKILLHRNAGCNYTVVCINAGSGHGKTSLLRVLYNDQQLTDAFDKRLWIQVSDKLDILMLLRKIVEFAMNDHCSITNLGYLQEMVEEEIADKKIALFLDDADIEDQQFWNSLLEVLNAGARGSVIVMATRSATVAALRGVATHSYFLGPLSEENNLMLLQQYAAVRTDIQTNPDLLMIAKRMISRFGANPLNLKAIGGLLSHTDTTLENDKFEGSAMPLQLCHDVLPIHLKKCLAFCSLFPEGYIFDRHHIILLWICHGCIRPVEGCELEDVGAEYFDDLLFRSFFQHSPVHNDKDEKFVMHELIYKVVESVTRNRYFKSEDLMISVPENILHLSLVSSHFQTVELMPKTEKLKDLHTFLVVQPERQQYKISIPSLNLVGLDDFFQKFTSLETLDLSHTDIKEVPGSIVSMRNLQYLSLNNTSIRALPSEFCSLSNLQILKTKDCRFLTELPGDIKNLLKLRHLDVTKELGYVHFPHGVGQLIELRTLPVFHVSGDSSHCCISELGSLHNLRGCLRLSGLESVKTGSKVQEINLKDKQNLQDLTLQWHDGGADINVEDDEADDVAEEILENLQPHANLQELTIRGYEGNTFPAWMQGSSLPSLVSLTLDGCCNCTQFPAVAQLPSLKFLSVRKMHDVQRLSSDVHGATKFPSLEVLNLWEMYGLEDLLEASESDCPRLHKICISRCPDLKRLPCIPSVNELVLHCCHQLPDIPELASLASLKIEGFHGVKSFSLPSVALPVLKKLEIGSCNELSSVHGLEALTTVQRLKIGGCPKLVLPTSGLTS